MKKTLAWIFVGALSLGCAALVQANEMNGATEKAIAALEEQWAQALAANNYDSAAPLLAEKLMLIDQDGKIYNRTETIAYGKATKFTSVGLEDMHVTVFGDTAIARYVYKSKGTEAAGKAFDLQVRYTDTWVKMPNGKWQCVAAHGSAVKKS